MSEPIPESVPTASKRRGPATKRAKLTDSQVRANEVEALFANPDREIVIPKGPQARKVAAPPEIVTNVQGSSAGAGSGEFHVYKASRRREYDRLQAMEEENEREKADESHKQHWEEVRAKDQEKLDKNRLKREKLKARKMKAAEKTEQNGSAKMETDGGETETEELKKKKPKKKLIGGPVQLPNKEKVELETDGRTEPLTAFDEDQENGVVIHDED